MVKRKPRGTGLQAAFKIRLLILANQKQNRNNMFQYIGGEYN